MTNYREHGVPPELFESTKRQLIAGQELSRNSISRLASDWADTIARRPRAVDRLRTGTDRTRDPGRRQPRCAKRYLDVNHAIIGSLTPSANASQSGAAAAARTMARENPLGKQTTDHAPPGVGGTRCCTTSRCRRSSLDPHAVKLANGITLIVQPETISDSVFVYGA